MNFNAAELRGIIYPARESAKVMANELNRGAGRYVYTVVQCVDDDGYRIVRTLAREKEKDREVKVA